MPTMSLTSLFLLCFPAVILAQLFQPDTLSFKTPVNVTMGLSASVIFSNLTSPRGITFDTQQNLLVVERSAGISALTRTVSPLSGWTRSIVVSSDAFTHGIQVDGNALYVSTASDVLVYKYDPTTRKASTPPSRLITGLPADGELTTHTLELERDGTGATIAILVGSGPKTNIDITARDPASGRSQVRRFPLTIPHSAPLQWGEGKVVAYGIRNPAGFTFPSGNSLSPVNLKTLLIVENGASIDNVTGLTPAFANDNPADEIESLIYPSAGTNDRPPFYGFPDCSTLWNPKADPINVPQYTKLPRGTQFSLNLPATTPNNANEIRNDIWCQDVTNNRPPAFNFQAHSVPLDIKQYGPRPTGVRGGLPAAWAEDIFVSFHGSFNRSPPTGYGVVHVPYPFGNVSVTNALGYSFLIQAADLSSCPDLCIRPVGLAFGKDDRLYVSSDTTGEIFVIGAAVFATNA